MYKFFIYGAVAFLLLLGTTVYQTHAGSLSERDYKRDAEKIMSKMWNPGLAPHDMNYISLRHSYARTSMYDPYGDTVLNVLNGVVEDIRAAEGLPERQKELSQLFLTMMQDQVGNFKVVTYAWRLAQENPLYGNYQFWNSLRGALFNSILKSGSGKNFREAYNVIIPDEEKALLTYFKYDVIDSLDHKKGAFYFKIYFVQPPIEGVEPVEFFINTTIPTEYTQLQESQKEKKLNIFP